MERSESKMKNFMKFAAVGVAGYLVGFFEMRYKVIKAIAQGYIENQEEEKENES